MMKFVWWFYLFTLPMEAKYLGPQGNYAMPGPNVITVKLRDLFIWVKIPAYTLMQEGRTKFVGWSVVLSHLKHRCKGGIPNAQISATWLDHFWPFVVQMNWSVVAPTTCQQQILLCLCRYPKGLRCEGTSSSSLGLWVVIGRNHAGGRLGCILCLLVDLVES